MKTKKKVLITGISGLLGNNLAHCLKDQYSILGLYYQHACSIDGIALKKLDLTDPGQAKSLVDEFQPDVLIHCAALSNIEYCEANQDLAYKSNVLATRYLVEALARRDCHFIYISTDAIYDEQTHLINEEHAVIPSNYYAQTKIEAEKEASKHPNTLILRTNIFGWNIQNKFSLGEWVINELSNRNRIKGFQDAQFSSIYTFELAKMIDKAIQKNIKGTYNAASRTHLSKYQFARQIAKRFQLDEQLIDSTSIDDFDFKAKRRKFMALDTTKIQQALDAQCPTMEECIELFYQDYQKGVPSQIKQGQLADIYPKLDSIPYGRQSITQEDIDAVVSVLKSSNLTQGPKINELETALAKVCSSKHTLVVNSGTSALHIACLAAGVTAGDEVITSPNTFVASANCAVYCGARPVFADIDLKTYNIIPSEIEKKITAKTKAIIPVHFAGQSCDMEAIKKIVTAKEKAFGKKIYIIEDASHALGSKYKNSEVGSCQYSDMAIMSFHPVKHITTGEGGAVLTNDAKLYKTLKKLRSHGITNDDDELFQAKPGTWYYEQQLLGFNYRLTDIQSALGLSQLKKLPSFIERRREIANKYHAIFKNTPHIVLPASVPDSVSNFHLFVLLIDFEAIKMSRKAFMQKLRDKHIITQVHYIPVVMQPFYTKTFQTNVDDYPNMKKYYSQCLSIPLFPAMSDQDVTTVFNLIHSLITTGDV